MKKKILLCSLFCCFLHFSYSQAGKLDSSFGNRSLDTGFIYIGSLNGHDYYKSSATYLWTEADSLAVSLGGHLATITNQTENEFIYEKGLNLSNSSTLPVFIGFTDEAIEGTFVWSNGEPVTYTNWNEGEPNNGAGGGEEDHVEMLPEDGTWNDKFNIEPRQFIIEFEPGALTVSLTTPTNNATYIAPADIKLTAEVTDTAGTISKVEFYSGTTLLHTETVAPYTYTWKDVPVGNYTLTAKATDDKGLSTTSTSVTVTAMPNRNLGSGFIYIGSLNGHDYYKSSATYLWTEADSLAVSLGGHLATITNQTENEFIYEKGLNLSNSSTLPVFIGFTDEAIEGTFVWSNGEPVTYTNWNEGEPNNGAGGGEEDHVEMLPEDGTWNDKFNIEPRQFIIEFEPGALTVSLTTPTNNATYLAPANIKLTATASDAEGTISKVEFYNGNTLLHTETVAPYGFKWKDVPLGEYTLTAKAYDNSGNVTTSAAVHISVVPNKAPTVSIVAPANNEHYAAPAYIHLEAAASDTDGRITRVEFYNGSTLIRTEYKYPYTYVWKGVPVGTYTITAVATDNWGAQTTSKAIVVKVKSSICSKEQIMTFKAYIDGSDYIHVKGSQVWYEHLNFELPGKWEGANEPTYINGNTWFPEWTDNISNIYTLLNPPLASSGISDVTLEVISARGTVTLTQVPDVNNNYEAVIFADDDAPAGAGWYEFNLKWKVTGDCVSDSNVRHVDLRQPRMNRSALGEKGQILKVTGDFKNNINIYPNPFQSRLKVELTPANTFQKIITLFDVNGKQVFNYSSRQNLIEINVKPLPNGIYFIRVNDGIGKLLYSGKVVKE